MRSDQELLDLWRGGDLTAGEELFERYYDVVYRFFSREVTADLTPLVQETFTACLEGRRSMDPEASFRVHLLGTAYGMLAAFLGQAAPDRGAPSGDESTETDLRPRSAPVEIAPSNAAMHESSTAPDLDLSPDQRDEQLRRRALRRLSFVDRVLIELHDHEALSEQEIAAIVGMAGGAVASRLRLARTLVDGITRAGS